MAPGLDLDHADRDERLGEAVEIYLELAEAGTPPAPEAFVTCYPDLGDDLRDALEGLSLVKGLVGSAGGPGDRRLEAGRQLAGYRIVGELGAGGMGIVYEAVHVDLDRPVALKVLDARATRDGSGGLRRFLNEARTAAALHHTNIVPVFDVGHVGGLGYYAMQRIEGSGLDRVIRALRRDRSTAAGSWSGRRTPPSRRPATPPAPASVAALSGLIDPLAADPWGATSEVGAKAPHLDTAPPFEPPRGSAYYRWVAEVGRQVALALAYAHGQGVIHRDIKPSNILVDAQGSIWVADFGLARRLGEPARSVASPGASLHDSQPATSNLTRTDGLVGTPRYMSPEQSRSEPVDGRTDVYSLGATLYELLSLRPPFNGRTTAELIEQIGSQEPPPIRQSDPRTPRDLQAIVLKALARRPADRYGSAQELADDLARFLAHEPVRARPIGVAGRAWRRARRHPAVTSVATVAAVVTLSVATVAYVRVIHERDRARGAERALQSALREQLLSQAALVRISPVPNRRQEGLDLLRQAAAMAPGAELRARLQGEAIAFLALRDIERRPELLTGPRSPGLSFGLEGGRLVIVSERGDQLLPWSIERRERLPPLATGPAPEADAEETRGAGRWDPRFFSWANRVVRLGSLVGVLWPDGRGIRLYDAITGARTDDLPAPGLQHLGLSAAGSRLLTVSREWTPDDEPNASERPPEPPSDGPGSENRDRSEDRDGSEDRDRARERDRRSTLRVYLWDIDHPQAPLATLDTAEPDDGWMGFPLVAPALDGETLATAWFTGSVVTIYSAADGQRLAEVDTKTSITALALGPYGVLAAAGGGAVRLWDAATQAPLTSLTPHRGFVGLLQFSPDGTLLALAGGGTDVELWDPANSTLVAALPTKDRVMDLAFDPEGRLLAAGQADVVALWGIVDPEVRARMIYAEGQPTDLEFGPSGWLALTSRRPDSAVRLWHPSRCPTTAQPLEGIRATTLAFDAAGRLDVVDGDSLSRIDILGTGASTEEIRLPRPASFGDRPLRSSQLRQNLLLSATPDRRRLAMVRYNQVLLWDIAEPDSLDVVEPPRIDDKGPGPGRSPRLRYPWAGLAIAPGGDRLYLLPHRSGELVAWSLGGDAARLTWSLPGFGATTMPAAALALSPDGKTLAVGTEAGTVVLLDARNGTVRARLEHSTQEQTPVPITALSYSPDGALLAVGTKTGDVELWSMPPAPEPSAAVPLGLPGHRGAVLALAFDTTGRQLATSGEDKAVEVWFLDRVRAELARLGLSW